MSRSLEDLRSSVRAIDRRIETMHMDAALLTGILPLPEGRKLWSSSEIDWDDPKIPEDMRTTYFSLLSKRHNLNQKVTRIEAENNNEIPRWGAERVAYGWLHVLGENGNDWLIKHKLTTVTLTDAILNNPNFLEEMI